MWPDRESNPGPLTYESGTLPTALRGPAHNDEVRGDVIRHLALHVAAVMSNKN